MKMIAESDLIIQMRGGRFTPITNTDLSLPTVRSEAAQNEAIQKTETMKFIEQARVHRMQENKNRTKYDSKIRDKEEGIFDKAVTKIVADDSQFEHMKTVHDIIDDCYQHTDAKVAEVMQQIVKVYNHKKSNRIDPKTDFDIFKVLKNSIAFPLGYEEPITEAEAILKDQKLKKAMQDFMDSRNPGY